MHLRLVTYNIHKGIGGVDRRYRPERIVETLSHYRPDIVFLQEVAEGMPRSRRHRQVDLLGDELGLEHRAFQANVVLTRGHYGNAILSRFPLSQVRDLDLTIPLKKGRRALFAMCRAHDGHRHGLLLCNCHLGLAGFERVIQLERILKSGALGHTRSRAPVIVGGDYNDVWGTLGERCMLPAGFTAACGKVKTFPAIMPVRSLDRVYFRGAVRALHSFACHRDIARFASDHLPVVVDFELG